MKKLINYLIKAKFCYVLIGFILGAMVADAANISHDIIRKTDAYDLAKLIYSVIERPEKCPYCGYEFVYFFNYTEDDLQNLMDKYLGENSRRGEY